MKKTGEVSKWSAFVEGHLKLFRTGKIFTSVTKCAMTTGVTSCVDSTTQKIIVQLDKKLRERSLYIARWNSGCQEVHQLGITRNDTK